MQKKYEEMSVAELRQEAKSLGLSGISALRKSELVSRLLQMTAGEEQKKAVRAGYDMDIIPSDLATFSKDAKALLKELQSQNERMFLMTFLILNTGKTAEELENNVFQAR